MNANARGWLMAIGALGALALVVQLTMEPFKKKPPPPPPKPTPTTAIPSTTRDASVDAPEAGAKTVGSCRELEQRYAKLREATETCETDDDCTFDVREAPGRALDGCGHAVNKHSSALASDAIAIEWRGGGCDDATEPLETCKAARPHVRCARGRCGEKPPGAVPPDWTRLRVRRVLRAFVPPDIVPADSQQVGRLENVFEGAGEKRTLSITARRATALTAKSVVAEGAVLVSQKAVRIDGAPATLFLLDERNPPLLSWFTARAGVEQADPLLGTRWIELDLRCSAKERCNDASTILASVELFQPPGDARDR